MKHLYNTTTTLQTESKVRIEANYNRTIHGMTKPGTVLYYKAPDDPAEHPMYVDAEGRNVPVSPTTLQPMTNSSGNLVDKNGVLLPVGDISGIQPHIDDVRIAVTSSDFDVKDQDGKEILISHDGEIIPTNDEGVPDTTLVDGVPWVIGQDGQPHAPLSRVFPLSSYVKPVRAENVPVNKNGTLAAKVEDDFPEYFDINSIVDANRPSRRGALIAWTASDTFDNAVASGLHGYRGARFYAAAEDMQYKYWTSPTTSDASGTTIGSSVATLDASWTTTGTNKTVATDFLSADFPSSNVGGGNFEKVLKLTAGHTYELGFNVLPQSAVTVKVELIEWTDDQPATPNYNSASRLKPARQFLYGIVPAGVSRTFNVDIAPSANTKTHALRITFAGVLSGAQKVTLTDLTLTPVMYPIAGVGPRAMYDRPINVNKIVIGVDYSIDETVLGMDSDGNKPWDTAVRILTDRGDGVFTWTTAATSPEIDDDGKITLYFNGSTWGEDAQYGPTKKIMGVQYAVYGMRRRDARVNIMEISARRTYDVSDLLLNYSVDSRVSDDSFVLPFGTVNSNDGNVNLSNHDGRFNSDNRYLLDRWKSTPDQPVFTTEENPFYQMLNESVLVEIDTATFVPGSTDKQFLRMITAQSGDNLSPGSSMNASIPLRDDAKFLESVVPGQTFYSGPTMSIVQVLYMLLDSVGFTSVAFADEDEHFSSHVGYFWTGKDEDSVWKVIEDVCRATQTVAFFDEFNVLNFKSLKGMYIDALSKSPSQVFTTEDLPGVLANIDTMDLEDKVSVNRVNINYREIAEQEKTASGIQPSEVVWEPDGTEVLRAGPILYPLNDKQVGKGGTSYLQIPSAAASTWPFSGMVQVEGEFIKYDGKQYRYHLPNGGTAYKYVYNDDERKELDKNNEYLAFKNTYSGRMKITERGAEETMIREHKTDPLTTFTRRYRAGTGTTKNNYTKGISVKNSKLYLSASKAKGTTFLTVSDGHIEDDRPSHMGSRFRMSKGGYAGVCFGLNSPNDDGIFVEVGTTDAVTSAGRPRGELRFYTRINGAMKYWGFGIDVPISKNKDYDLDIHVRDGGQLKNFEDYTRFYEITLKYGDKGNNVRALQTALNLHNSKLAVDGKFGTATRDAVKRFQRRRNLTVDGIVRKAMWRAMQTGTYDVSVLAITATIDGVYSASIQIPKSQLPTGYIGGRFGVFTRATTDAQFEYMYATRGMEDVEFDDSTFFDYIKGGYVSDQLDAGWIYTTRLKTFTRAGKKVTRRRVNDQLYMQDFGPIAHEVRDYEVVFDKEAPSLSSFMYYSNESQVHLTDYTHKPFGAKFRLANRARHDAILNGEDSITFGPEDAVDQKMMIYGRTLKIEDQRTVTVSNQTSINSRGAEELSIDVDWIQSKQAAEKLGSHIVEALSHPVPTFGMDVFGHAAVRVGQIVSIYNPQLGVGESTDPENANRFFVYSVRQSNNGRHDTSITVRQVIGSGGKRHLALSDILAKNNNAMNINPNIESYKKVGDLYVPSGYEARSGVKMAFKAPVELTSKGGGAAELIGTGATPHNSSMLANPFPGEVGRFSHPYGEYYLATASVTAHSTIAVALVMEGRQTSGGSSVEMASTTMVIKSGETKRISLKGQFLSNPELPELEVALRVLNPENTTQGALAGQKAYVNDFFYRASQSPDGIYPLVGGEALRKL